MKNNIFESLFMLLLCNVVGGVLLFIIAIGGFLLAVAVANSPVIALRI